MLVLAAQLGAAGEQDAPKDGARRGGVSLAATKQRGRRLVVDSE